MYPSCSSMSTNCHAIASRHRSAVTPRMRTRGTFASIAPRAHPLKIPKEQAETRQEMLALLNLWTQKGRAGSVNTPWTFVTSALTNSTTAWSTAPVPGSATDVSTSARFTAANHSRGTATKSMLCHRVLEHHVPAGLAGSLCGPGIVAGNPDHRRPAKNKRRH